MLAFAIYYFPKPSAYLLPAPRHIGLNLGLVGLYSATIW